jgi:hypothetical protein
VRRVLGESDAHQLQAAVVERKNTFTLGFGPPEVDEIRQSLGFGVSQIDHFGSVDGDVIQLPAVVVETLSDFMSGDGLPAVGVNGAVSMHLEILNRLL